MKHSKLFVILSILLAIVTLLAACASQKVTVKFTENGCTYSGPAAIPYGKFNVDWSVKDRKHNKTVLLIITLANGKTIDDLKASKYGETPAWVTILWNDEEDAFGAELDKTRAYTFEHDLNTVDSYQGQPLYLVCGNEEGPTNPLGPIEVTK